MKNVTIKNYSRDSRDACLALFDKNCPEYFAPNERADYENFLNNNPTGYQLCTKDDKLIGVFGLFNKEPNVSRLEWIMISPNARGIGLGSIIMNRVLDQAKNENYAVIHIATSHVAYKFFEKFGAVIVKKTLNGWGSDMHKFDMELHL